MKMPLRAIVGLVVWMGIARSCLDLHAAPGGGRAAPRRGREAPAEDGASRTGMAAGETGVAPVAAGAEIAPPRFTRRSALFVGGVSVRLIIPPGVARVVYTLDGSEPTLGSPRYMAPIPLTATTLVRARSIAAGESSAMSSTASRRFQRIAVRPVRNVRINFQPLLAPKPMGYLIDSGRRFHVLGGGCAFGWDRDNTNATRERGKHDNPLRDTLIFFGADRCWEIAVFNGTYQLTICVGDAERKSENQTIYAEDEAFCSGLDLEAGQFEVVTKTVAVKDGLLTLHSHDVAQGPELTRVNWLRLRAMGE